MKLLVTVDTEEEGLFGGGFRRRGNTVEHIPAITRFQDVCDRWGVRPTYLVDTPVTEDDRAVEILGRLLEADRCEIGAHLHPWCAPPLEEEISPDHSYLCNLPPALQRAKLLRLTQTIRERFGRRPRSFRAGRYGLDVTGARILAELDYLVDSSVIGLTDYSASGGPSFPDPVWHPYRVGGEDLTEPAADGSLLEAPISVGFSRPDFARAREVYDLTGRPLARTFRLRGILDRLNLVRRIKFSPEQADARRMRQLVDAYHALGAPCMVMLLHSTSLAPGYSPYAKTRRQSDRLYRDLEATFAYCLRRRGMVSEMLTEFAESFSGVKRNGVPGVRREFQPGPR